MTADRPLRVSVVDDEPLAVKRLVRLLEASGRVIVVSTFTNPMAALDALQTSGVDALFLDIEMPGLTGFALLERLPSPPAVVFTTAHDEYALRAFDTSSIDYLLKPVEPLRLERALDKLARFEGTHQDLHTTLDRIATALSPARKTWPDRIASTVGDRTQLVDLASVTHFYASDKLTYAAVAPRPVIIDATLNELEARLDPKCFLRIHRATLVNLAFVSEIRSGLGGAVVKLKDGTGTELPIARDRLREVKQRFEL